jgi:uncharacterized protein
MNQLDNFSTVFLSIILEGFPFIIIGAFVSSMIQIFVSEELIGRLIPKRKFLGLICTALMGLAFPVCECAIIPIARRLIKKGVPLNMAVTFMLSVPIINPIVLLSTYYAFLGKPSMVLARAGFGVISAIAIGYLIGELHTEYPLKRDIHINESSSCGHYNCSCGYKHGNMQYNNVARQILGHTSRELYDIGKLFIIGAAISSAMQTFVPRQYIAAVGGGNVSSILVMMLLAFVLSICSETDAFIARTFAGQFTTGSIVGFLIFGPMIDVKNTIILTGSFNIRLVVKLVFLIFGICFIAAVLSNFIPGLAL